MTLLAILVLGAAFTLGYQLGAVSASRGWRRYLRYQPRSLGGWIFNVTLWTVLWPAFWVILFYKVKIR